MRYICLLLCFLCIAERSNAEGKLPADFVYLKDIDPSIQQDIRYYSAHNFVGKPIQGYLAPTCILTRPAAESLAKVQHELQQSKLSLKVYDCYRPQQAVDDFVRWSENDSKITKAEFYPDISKKRLFIEGYIAARSGHTRGSTMDLTIVPADSSIPKYANQELVSCKASYLRRFPDNSLDMGTGFDCLDPMAHPDNREVGIVAYQNRMTLQALMEKYGFAPLTEEWWHFTLKNEPHPNTYFNFPIA